jgi:hypothetical protein
MALRLAQTRNRKLPIRVFGVVLLVASVLVLRVANGRQQAVFIYAVLACVWMIFFLLGVKALQVRKQLRVQLRNPRLLALATRPQAEWLGLVLALLGALVLAFGAFTISGTRQDWSALGGIAVFISWYFIWRGAYAMSLNGALHYSSLFGGYRQVRFEDIGSARIIVGLHPTRPTVRLEIYPVVDEEPVVVINRKVFKRTDIDSVVTWLGPKLKKPE